MSSSSYDDDGIQLTLLLHGPVKSCSLQPVQTPGARVRGCTANSLRMVLPYLHEEKKKKRQPCQNVWVLGVGVRYPAHRKSCGHACVHKRCMLLHHVLIIIINHKNYYLQ